MALTISITALPVLAIMLREFGIMRTRFGTFLLNASVINELCAVTGFAILLAVTTSGEAAPVAIATSCVTVALFLTTILSIHMGLRVLRQIRIWDRVVQRFRSTWRSREGGFAVLMVIGLGSALYSQFLGLTFLVGAFYAGLLITPESAGVREHRTISFVFEAVTWGFFIPLFFALVGFGMNFPLILTSFTNIIAFALLCSFALIAKILIGSAVTRSLSWSAEESMAAGWLMTSRGAVELAMAVILLDIHVFDVALYTIVAGVGLITTMVSPSGPRGSFGRSPPAVGNSRSPAASPRWEAPSPSPPTRVLWTSDPSSDGSARHGYLPHPVASLDGCWPRCAAPSPTPTAGTFQERPDRARSPVHLRRSLPALGPVSHRPRGVRPPVAGRRSRHDPPLGRRDPDGDREPVLGGP